MEDVGATVAVQPSERLYCLTQMVIFNTSGVRNVQLTVKPASWRMFSCKTRNNAFELSRRNILYTRTPLSSSSLYQKVFKLATQWYPFESLPSEDLQAYLPWWKSDRVAHWKHDDHLEVCDSAVTYKLELPRHLKTEALKGCLRVYGQRLVRYEIPRSEVSRIYYQRSAAACRDTYAYDGFRSY